MVGFVGGSANAQSPKVESFRLDLAPDAVVSAEAGYTRAVAQQAYLYQLPAYLHQRQVTEFLEARVLLSPNEPPMGGWILVRDLSTPETTNTLPNVDTLYGASFLSLDQLGPIVLTLPAASDRYYSVVLHDAWYNCFSILSPRTIGNQGGRFLIVPPNWTGDKPEGIDRVIVAPTSMIAAFQRIFLGIRDDINTVRRIQDQITLSPLAGLADTDARFPKINLDGLQERNLREISDPIEFFRLTNAYTARTPPPSADERLLALFASAGLGPGQRLPEESHLVEAIRSGAADAQVAINAKLTKGPYRNGWRIPDPDTALPSQGLLGRAAVQLSQIASLPNEEAMYFVCARDANDALLDGSQSYMLTFPKGQLPPIAKGAFWSLTMYDERSLLVDNPIDRYIIRPDTPGLTFAEDGSLSIYVQSKEPKGVPEGNWLPSPEGKFIVVLRAYWPEPQMLRGDWFPPAMKRLGNAGLPNKTSANQPPSSGDAEGLERVIHATAVQANIYGYATMGMYERLSREVLDPQTRQFHWNEFRHYTNLSTPEVAPFRAPNNDTLYSIAWLDVRNEPVVLSAPATDERYWCAQVLDFDSNTLTNFGARLDGTKAGQFAVLGPNWKGDLPSGLTRSIQSPTGFVLILLRVLVDGPKDLAAAVRIQSQFTFAPLSQNSGQQQAQSATVSDSVPLFKASSPAERMKVLDRLLKLDPQRVGEEALLTQFAGIGLGPGKAQLVTQPGLETLARAEADALAAIRAAGPKTGTLVNGWLVMSEGIGTYGFDYLQRASVWEGGPLANVPEESLYPSAIVDSTGLPLDGKQNAYTIHFPPGQLPPVDFFWSVTMYDRETGMLVANPIDRYSIGNRTPGLKFGEDGSLTIYLQHAKPAQDQQSNWLPAPSGPFYLSMRLYGPREEARNGQWKPAPIVRKAD
jgi:hypothetical protein